MIDNQNDRPMLLKARIFKAKKVIPKNIVELFISEYPEYSTGEYHVKCVLHCQRSDSDITAKLEKLAMKFSNKELQSV